MTSRRLLALAVLALVLVLAGTFAVRWWTSPDLFDNVGAGFKADPRPVDKAVIHAGISYPSEDDDNVTVTLRDVRATSATNTARAVASFAVCRFEGDAVGVVHGPLGRWCEEIVPVDRDTEVPYTFTNGEMLVMTITPGRRGESRVSHVRIDYATGRSHLWQRGEQTIRTDVAVRAR